MFNTQWIGYKTILKREITRLFRIWTQTFIPPIITMTLYFLIFGKFIGSKLDSIHSFSYIEFIIPGLIMMSIVTNSYTNVASTFFGAKFQKNIEELIVSPLKPQTILLGYISGGIFRGLCVGVLVTIISTLFSNIHIHNISLIILTAILTSTFFALCGMINGIFAKKFDDIAIIPTFILTPLTYLGGVFYPISILPEFWQKLSYLNPMIYLINIFRFGFIGISDIPILTSFILLIIITLIFWKICIFCLKKGIGIKE